MDTSSDAERWPEFHPAKYANQVVLALVAFTLFKWYGDDVGLLGFDSFAVFALWLIFAASANGLTVFVVSTRSWSRYWKSALFVTIAFLCVSVAGFVALWGNSALKDGAGSGVAFVYGTHLLNLATLIQVARLRKRI